MVLIVFGDKFCFEELKFLTRKSVGKFVEKLAKLLPAVLTMLSFLRSFDTINKMTRLGF